MRATLICALVLLVPCAATAETYKCKRPDGRTSFQDQPCEPGSTGAPVYLSDPSPATEPADVAPASKPPVKNGKSTAFERARQEQSLRARNAELEARNHQLEARNRAMACNAARRNLNVLRAQRPVFRYDSKGNRQYVEDDNRQAEIAAAQQSVATNCEH